MPPDIIAGLIALTGPPGAAGTGKAAEPPASRTVSAAVFAALLTQSSPPTLKLAAPKTDAAPMVKLGLAAKQQTSKHSKTLSILKTMDTLPPLSFPSTGTATKASELPLLNAPAHKAAADDSKTVAAKAPALTPGAATPLNSSLDLVPIAVPVQAVPVQSVLPPASAPVPHRFLCHRFLCHRFLRHRFLRLRFLRLRRWLLHQRQYRHLHLCCRNPCLPFSRQQTAAPRLPASRCRAPGLFLR